MGRFPASLQSRRRLPAWRQPGGRRTPLKNLKPAQRLLRSALRGVAASQTISNRRLSSQQRFANGVGEIQTECRERSRRKFFGEKLDETGRVAHFFTIGKPSRSRDS